MLFRGDEELDIKNNYLKNKMKVGVIGLSAIGKSTLLNSLIDKHIANIINGLIGPVYKENQKSGQTKNPVRYYISRDVKEPIAIVGFPNGESKTIELFEIAKYAKDNNNKCTVTLKVNPSIEFERVMEMYGLREIEFIDTQGLLDTLDEEILVPVEIEQCDTLLYLYNSDSMGSRGDYIDKYKSFLNKISDKPILFLETNVQAQIRGKHTKDLDVYVKQELEELDIEYTKLPDEIMKRYKILTGNDAYNNRDTFILNSVLSASESSVNYYKLKLTDSANKDDNFAKCLRIISAHTLQGVFKKLNGLKESISKEFEKVNGEFKRDISFNIHYGLLWDVFVRKWKCINYLANPRVISAARNDSDMFKDSLKEFNEGALFNVKLNRKVCEIHTEYGYHCEYETYENQEILNFMQLILDSYKGYLRNIVNVDGENLSKAIQMHLLNSISEQRICRDTNHTVTIIREDIFKECLTNLRKAIGDINIKDAVYIHYDKFDIEYEGKKSIEYNTSNYLNTNNIKSLITKLDYICAIINNKINDKASKSISDMANNFIEQN